MFSRPLDLTLVICAIAAAGGSGSADGAAGGSAATDEAWMRRLAAGEPQALEAIYDRHSRIVFSLACRIVGRPADAEDVTQDVFTHAWKRAAQYDPRRGSVAAWLLVVTRSRALDRLRRGRSRGDGLLRTDSGPVLPELAGEPPDYDQQLITDAEVKRLQGALGELNSGEREAIELAYFSGLTQSEIAERLGQPLGTVKTRVRAGLTKLRTAMTGATA